MELKQNKMKCDNCKNQKFYTTGGDEYPAYTTISYCSKGHWENGNPQEEIIGEPFFDCKDFKDNQ